MHNYFQKNTKITTIDDKISVEHLYWTMIAAEIKYDRDHRQLLHIWILPCPIINY